MLDCRLHHRCNQLICDFVLNGQYRYIAQSQQAVPISTCISARPNVGSRLPPPKAGPEDVPEQRWRYILDYY